MVGKLLLPLWLGMGLQPALAADEAAIGPADIQTQAESPAASAPSLATEGQDAVAQTPDNLEQLLADVEKRYGETAASLRSLHKQIEQIRRNIDKIATEIFACQRAIAKERKDLAGQVRAAYEMGQQEELKLLLNQQDPALSSRIMIYYSYINKARMAKIAQLESEIAKLEQWDKQKQAETQQLELDSQQKQLQQAALNEVRQQRKALLANIAATSYQEQLSYLTESENKLRGLIASLPKELGISKPTMPQDTPKLASAPEQAAEADSGFSDLQGDFSGFKGRLPWPVQGKLAITVNNLQHTNGEQNGVLIEAKEGVDVRAVAAGKISFADWMRSYGYLVIIDHGNGYMTLYAFNQSLYKHVNDTVQAGEVIASVGQSGGRSQPGLYFGIRRNAMPLDPLVWCRNN